MNQDILGITHAIEKLRENSLFERMRKFDAVHYPGERSWVGIRNKIADSLMDLAEHVRVQPSHLTGQAHSSK